MTQRKQRNRAFSAFVRKFSSFLRNKKNDLFIPVVLAAATLVGGVVIIELLLRQPNSVEIPFENVPHPYVGFRPPSNAEWRSPAPSPSSRKREIAVAYTNEDGLRIPSTDYRLTRKKPPGQKRIGFLGGSTVHIGTQFDVTLPGALKRALAIRYPDGNIEVINAGIISAISRQELIFLTTTLVDYELDFLVVYDGINDSGQMLYFEKRPNYPYHYSALELAWDQFVSGKRDPLWRVVLNRSSILRRLWPDLFGNKFWLDPIPSQDLITNVDLRKQYSTAHSDNWEKILRVARAYDIEPIFVLQPTSLYSYFPNGETLPNVGSAVHGNLYANYLVYEEFRNSLRRFSDRHPDVVVADLSSFLPAEAFYDGAHVYDDINDVIADRLVELFPDLVSE